MTALPRPLLLVTLLTTLLSACDSEDPAPLSGRLVDARLEGLRFQNSPSGLSGATLADGGFSCHAGDKLSFSVGDVMLGTADCKTSLSLGELAGSHALTDVRLQNRLVFLQALDDDDEPGNGIKVAPTLAEALKTKSLDFTLTTAAFDVAAQALLPAGLSDALGQPYAARTLGAQRRTAALEHHESTLAAELGTSPTSTSTQESAGGEVQITKHALRAEAAQYVPYEGSNAAAKKEFPQGFYPAVGSGLAFKGKGADGSLEFWGITDRGPNGDSPSAPNPAPGASGTSVTKMFPAPSFAPSIGVITVGVKGGARITSLLPLKADAATRLTGRPLPLGTVGSSAEIPLDDRLRFDGAKAGFDARGLDSESLVYDASGKAFWSSDEYGPFIVKLDAVTGVELKRYEPGSGAGKLPAVLKERRANRGMEGLAQDPQTGRLHGFLQSPIDPLDAARKSIEVIDTQDLDQDGKNTDKIKVRDFAPFARWLEFDPSTESSRLFAYPLSYPLAAKGEKWDRNRTGSAKLGDLVALGNGRFIVIEQGTDATGVVRNFLMLVELPAQATDIAGLGSELERNGMDGVTASATPWAQVVKLKKTVLLDLNAAGWKAEKAEGLTVVDAQTLALINDSDFGLSTTLVDAAGKPVEGDPTECTVDANGVIQAGCAAGATGVQVRRGNVIERRTRLWLLKFPKPLAGYALP